VRTRLCIEEIIRVIIKDPSIWLDCQNQEFDVELTQNFLWQVSHHLANRLPDLLTVLSTTGEQ
jgi:hypothetical protein